MNPFLPSVTQCDCLNTHKAEACANTLKGFCHLHAYKEANTAESILKDDVLSSVRLTRGPSRVEPRVWQTA